MTTFKRMDYLIIAAGIITAFSIFYGCVENSGLAICLNTPAQCLDASGLKSLAKTYDEKLRSDFFAGFLAVGAFLLSLKTFIVMTMKTSVYDTKEYKNNWQNQFNLNAKVGSLYAGLKRLNDCLFNSIFSSLTAAVAQVSIGLIGGVIVTLICIFLCSVSVYYLIYCLYIVKRNLDAVIPTD